MIAGVLEGGLKSVVAVVAVFLVLVTIHEFGHFIVAKWSGVLVPRFAIGFGPPLFKFERGETEYSIRMFPLGGYVQLAGEIPQDTFFKAKEPLAIELDDQGKARLIGSPEDIPGGIRGTLAMIDSGARYRIALDTADGYQEFAMADRAYLVNGRDRIRLAPPDRQMNRKPVWKRMLIILAGPAMNVLLTIVLFAIVIGVIGMIASPTQIAQVVPGSPAARAGFHVGDVITAVDGQPTPQWPQLVQAVEAHPNHLIRVSIQAGTKSEVIPVVPRKRRDGVGFLGIAPTVTHSVPLAVESGVAETGYYTQLIYNALAHLFVHKAPITKELAGPVKIVSVIDQQAQLGILNVINLTAILSLNLALFNLLPIPALDGSRFLFMVVEFIRGKPIDPKKEYWVHAVGFALLIGFTIVITYFDVAQLL